MAFAAGLGNDEHRERFMRQRLVGVGAGQKHERIGAGSKGAPGLDTVNEPTTLGGSGGGFHTSDIGAVVGFGDGNGSHDLSRSQLGQPLAPLFFGAASEQSTSEDLGASDEGAASTE